MADEPTNGNGQAATAAARLYLEFDMAAGKLRIEGCVPNNDTALDMLGRATRYYKMQARAEIMMEIQAQRAEAARVQGILHGGRKLA